MVPALAHALLYVLGVLGPCELPASVEPGQRDARPNSNGSDTWRDVVSDEISRLRHAIDVYEKARKDAIECARAPQQGVCDVQFWKAFARSPAIERCCRADRIVRNQILRLWSRTGICLFDDISAVELVERGSMVGDRYSELVASEKYESEESLARAGLDDSIEKLKGQYCWTALEVLAHIVDWDETPFKTSPRFVTLGVQEEIRLELHELFVEWRRKHADSLVWNAESHRIRRAEDKRAVWPVTSELLDRVILSTIKARRAGGALDDQVSTDSDAESPAKLD